MSELLPPPEHSYKERPEYEQAAGEMTVVEHLTELRRRLIIMLVAVAVGTIISYCYAAELVHIITAPAGKLYYMNPAEAFTSYLKVSLFAGLVLALPVVLYQSWAFIVPALTRQERRALVILVPASMLLFAVGLAFSYYFVLPAGIKFFLGFATDSLQPLFSLGQYLSFVLSFLLPFGLIFQLPLFIGVLAKMGVVTSAWLKARRKYVFVLAFVIGAIISPTPDVFSQTMVAVPLVILYELSVMAVKFVLRR